MNKEPWKGWIPGVLSKSQLKELCEKGLITGVDVSNDKLFDHSSLDLCLTSDGYEMKKGSVKPFGPKYKENILKDELADPLPKNKDGFKLIKKHTYLFKLRENIAKLKNTGIFGQATAKSTIGRVDVLARLIVDGMDCYEGFNPNGLAKGTGDLYLEITPMTFCVKVKEDIPLSQLRLFYGDPKNVEIKGKELYETLLFRNDDYEIDGSLSVDLSYTKIYNSNKEGCAFSTKDIDTKNNPIELWGEKKLKPKDYWNLENPDEKKRLRIEQEKFYIIRSKDRISLRPGVAVYCRATDESIGEMRIHYAGFVHPFFGMDRKDGKEGTPLIFEVRGHNVDVSLRDGEKMAILTFYRMSKDCEETEKDKDKKQKNDPYNEQELKLSKIFKEEWK